LGWSGGDKIEVLERVFLKITSLILHVSISVG